MNTPALCPENPCYRAEIKVDILTPTVFLYSTVNNMAISRELPSLQSITAFESEFPSEDVIIVGDPVHSKFLLAGAVTANRSFTFLRRSAKPGDWSKSGSSSLRSSRRSRRRKS